MNRYTTEVCSDVNSIVEIENKIAPNLKIFQTFRWLTAVGEDFKAVICYDKTGVVKGYLPLVKTQKFSLKSYHIPPYTPYFGPLILEESIGKQSEVIEEVLRPVLKEKHLDFAIDLRDNNLLPYIKMGFTVEAKQNHIIRIHEPDSQTWQIHPSKKRYLKKLLELQNKNEISAVWGEDAKKGILTLSEITSERAGFKENKSVLRKLVETTPHQSAVCLLIKDSNGDILAGAFCPKDQKAWYHLVNVSSRKENSILDKANILSTYLLISNAIKSCCLFDCEGSSIPGIAEFYRMMGGQPTVKFRLQKTRSFTYFLMRAVKQRRVELHGK